MRIGHPATAGVETLPDSIQRSREWCPDVAVELVVDGSAQHLRDLQAGLIDAAVLRVAPGERIAMPTLPLGANSTCCWWGQRTHWPGGVSSLATSCRVWGLVVPARRVEPAIHDHLLANAVGLGGASLAIALEVTTLESLYGAVCSGLGVGILPWSSTRMLRTGDIVVRPFAEPAPVTTSSSRGPMGQPAGPSTPSSMSSQPRVNHRHPDRPCSRSTPLG